ncbi:MAG: GNAT family N-acetyltransferase [Pseudomonadota bacterium]
MTVRPFHPNDAEALSAVYRRAVTELGPRGYTPPQVAAWLTLTPSPDRLLATAGDGRVRLVSEGDGGQPVAFTDLEPDGHIDLLYCAPEAAGQGHASALYRELERTARERGMERLYAEASELSRDFFVRRGFTVLHVRRFEIAGVPVHNYAVEKRLAP